ncbi:MAG TPA: ABC transporter permease [Candidatus Acidoferrales bacterium]|nr:ABC transporter permease [Candidatus Acidoferrales bacterium]
MMSLGEFGRRIAMLARRRKFDREMDEEMRWHLELREKEQAANGVSAKEAHATARKNFGNALALREASHDSWGWAWLEHLAQDLRFAFRMLRKSPGFAVVAVLTLALGIGANTAIFSVVNAILLRPLPIHDPSRVVVIHFNIPKLNLFHTSVSPPDFHNFSKHTNVFASTALFLSKGVNLTGAGQPQRLLAMRSTATLFPLLGIRPILGRTFTASEDTYGNSHVVLLSEGLWKSAFGAAKNTIGKRVQLDNESYQIVGVLPEKLQILYPHIQLWVPMAFSPHAFSDQEEGDLCCMMVARLRAGVSLQQAQSVMNIDAGTNGPALRLKLSP